MKLPKLGEGVDSGVVVNILVREGDRVAADQPILELENEKAIAAIPSTAAGVVTRIYVKPGEKVSVGQPILALDTAAAPAAAPAVAKPPPPPTPVVATPPPAPPAAAEPLPEALAAPDVELTEPVAAPVASPSLRRIARDLGIDLRRIRGSGRGGRIEIADLRAYIQRLQALAARATAAPAAPTVAPAPAAARPAPEPIDFSKWGPITRQPLSPLRQVIARRMTESWTSIPHVTQFGDADFTRLNALRKQHGPAYEQRGVKLTLTPLIIKAVVAMLQRHPQFNSSLDEVTHELVLKKYFHIGIAVDTEHGLIVPVVRDADKKSVLELARDVEELARKARERKVSADDLKGGTFTISNQGAIGGAHFTPIINRPEVAILGLGRGALQPVVADGRIEPRLLTPLALSYDHRVIDGGMAARFIVDLIAALENFDETLLQP
ncbi:MAG: 2-oxo acid dehydrogenase subunit E2 [Verrucomicrobiales bacterium]|nr:2-oxo acid dehydrogenase subunit E2 [Verrucomicrobiales bacterium]